MKISPYVSWYDDEDMHLIINTSTKKCISLDETGCTIWNLLQKCDTLEDVILKICAMYPSDDHDAMNKDISDFYRVLVEQEIIVNS